MTEALTDVGSLTAFAFVLTRDRQLAEDLAQEALLRLLQAPDVDSPSAYARRIVTNLYLGQQRRLTLWRRHAPSLLAAERVDGPDEGAGRRDELWRAVGALPPRQRAVVALRYYEDLSYADIALVLDCPAATARSLAARALARLRVVVDDPTHAPDPSEED